MSDADGAGPPLTAEQRAVVELPFDVRALVTAEAGAGKTHTLIRRLDFLVSEEEVSAGEILVLSFSRAAVRELRARLARHGDAARHVRAQTFDSWALDLLTQVRSDVEWPSQSFSARINAAREAIEEGLADEPYEDLQHVVIDEVQDLVGERREMVEALLDRFDCGFTVVGDPAQSIYGFTVADAAQRAMETNQFFVWLRNSYGEDLTELSLTRNFRARTSDAKAALPYGPWLRKLSESGEGSGRRFYEALHGTLRGDLLNLGDLDALSCSDLGRFDGTTAVLCRNNGQALVVSGILAAYDIEHRLQRSARDRVAPAWIGLLFKGSTGSVLNRRTFDDLVPMLPLPVGTDPDQAWRLLRRTGSGRGSDRSLDLGRLRAALAAGRLPDELTAQPPTRLVVSSFHRAKGLEFDRVVIVDPGPLRVGRPPEKDGKGKAGTFEIDADEEARALYVAMTRPRNELFWLNPPDTRFVSKERKMDRWARGGFRFWVRAGLELIGGDAFTDQPAGMRDFEADVTALQDYLATEVHPGHEVTLERLYPDPIEPRLSPPYRIVHRGKPIGTASEQFREQLYRYLMTSNNYVPRNWPERLTEVRIDAVETVAGSEAAGINAGLGPYGVWLAPRLVGLSSFTWDEKKEDSGVTAQ